MGDHENSLLVLPGGLFEQRYNLAAVLRIQISGGFISQDQGKARDQGVSDGHMLLRLVCEMAFYALHDF